MKKKRREGKILKKMARGWAVIETHIKTGIKTQVGIADNKEMAEGMAKRLGKGLKDTYKYKAEQKKENK